MWKFLDGAEATSATQLRLSFRHLKEICTCWLREQGSERFCGCHPPSNGTIAERDIFACCLTKLYRLRDVMSLQQNRVRPAVVVRVHPVQVLQLWDSYAEAHFCPPGPSEDCFVGMAPTRSPSMRSLSPNPSVCLAPCLSPAMDTVSQPSDASSPTSLPVSSACAFSSLAVEPVHAAPPRAYPRDHMLNSYHRTGRVGGRGTSTGSSISPCTPIRARGKVDQRRRASSARVRARRLRGAVDAVPVVGVPADVV